MTEGQQHQHVLLQQQQQQPQQQQVPQAPETLVDPAQLLALIQRMEAQIRDLSARIPADPQPPPPPRVKLSKPANPPFFGGKGNEVLSLDSWIFAIEQHNLVVGMGTDHLIPFAASFLAGHATTWWQHTYTEHRRLHPTMHWTWVDFTSQLRAQFQPLSSEQLSHDILHGLKQTTSVVNYISNF